MFVELSFGQLLRQCNPIFRFFLKPHIQHHTVQIGSRGWRALLGVDFGVVIEDLTASAHAVAGVDLGIGTCATGRADTASTGGSGTLENNDEQSTSNRGRSAKEFRIP